MAVKIGHASISEKGTKYGTVGDQTGREVTTRNWYDKGWDCVLRPISPYVADTSATYVEQACANNNVGYSQASSATTGRNSLRTRSIEVNWNAAKITTPCNTDCSALMAQAAEAADVNIYSQYVKGNAPATGTMRAKFKATGEYMVLTDKKYTDSDKYLMRGDILLRAGSHTAMVLTNGTLPGAAEIKPENVKLGSRILKNGRSGDDVRELQRLLIQLANATGDKDYLVGDWGADGDYGDATELAVRHLQKKAGITVDGQAGPDTLKALYAALDQAMPDVENDNAESGTVRIVNGNCWVRREPKVADGNEIGVAKKGSVLKYLGQTSENGWRKVEFEGAEGWVSGKYSKLEGV